MVQKGSCYHYSGTGALALFLDLGKNMDGFLAKSMSKARIGDYIYIYFLWQLLYLAHVAQWLTVKLADQKEPGSSH